MPTLCPALLKWPLVVAPIGDDTMYGKEGDGTGGGAGPGGGLWSPGSDWNYWQCMLWACRD